jgi:hypothetical protein
LIDADGKPEQVAWTATGAANGLLVLDRNHNGAIDDGSELFSDVAPQPTSQHPNGFLALAEFDKVDNGGNSNGFLDPGDSIYQELRIWIDQNHDGIAQAKELIPLADAGVTDIALEYREASRIDQYGNKFRYRAKINSLAGNKPKIAVWAYDVLLTFQVIPAPASNTVVSDRVLVPSAPPSDRR